MGCGARFVESIIHEGSHPAAFTRTHMTTAITWPDAARQAAFEDWLQALTTRFGLNAASLEPATADASFRRYLRIQGADGQSYIVMTRRHPRKTSAPSCTSPA